MSMLPVTLCHLDRIAFYVLPCHIIPTVSPHAKVAGAVTRGEAGVASTLASGSIYTDTTRGSTTALLPGIITRHYTQAVTQALHRHYTGITRAYETESDRE